MAGALPLLERQHEECDGQRIHYDDSSEYLRFLRTQKVQCSRWAGDVVGNSAMPSSGRTRPNGAGESSPLLVRRGLEKHGSD
ncbi:hypothetical protein C2U69_04175 [Cupriavidus pinatubonensis]|nr:hypothetical protein C2U69_04175 [Cupriavidus pinatubonensis]